MFLFNKKMSFSVIAALFLFVCLSVNANKLTLTSNDITDGKLMSKAQEFSSFGCTGNNISPQLSWTGVPEGTEAFALFVYDPDAPTGSGWWHWQLVNIPKNITSLEADSGNKSGKNLPLGSLQIENDYGFKHFGGACPPNGHGVHRYQFTLYALSTKLNLPENASSALTGYMVKANAIASATIEALYARD